jgi:hypothetical protein
LWIAFSVGDSQESIVVVGVALNFKALGEFECSRAANELTNLSLLIGRHAEVPPMTPRKMHWSGNDRDRRLMQQDPGMLKSHSQVPPMDGGTKMARKQSLKLAQR